MDFLIQQYGKALIGALSAGLFISIFFAGTKSMMAQMGDVVKAKGDAVCESTSMKGITLSKRKENITFTYLEQTYEAGKKVNLVAQFQALNAKGEKKIVELTGVYDAYGNELEHQNGMVVFPNEGIYAVKVRAVKSVYEIHVPVIKKAV
ncbi:MAG: hypothetical protein K6A30_01885 [Lachnospiraceae bacterium]|nr:hypothetical protein [Lachnospiraceae bacterium]